MSLDTLQQYGNTFQTKVLAVLASDLDFLAQMRDALVENLFESDSKNFLLKVILDHYTEFSNCPTIDVFTIKIKEISKEVFAEAVKKDLKEVYLAIQNAENFPFIKKEFETFCFHQGIKRHIIESVDLLKDGKYNAIEASASKAFKAFQKRDLGHIYEDAVMDRLVNHPRLRVIPTEWDVINEIIDGGPGEGDLCILVGAAGASKTWSLVSIGMHALKLGKNVVHFTLELNENYTAKRYDSKLTGIPSQDLKYHSTQVIAAIEEKVKGKLRIFFHPTKTATINTLKHQIDLLIAWGVQPDLIIVDYADLLRNDNINHQKGGSYAEIGSIYEDLRGLAGIYQVPVWTASQAHRSAQENEIITGDQIAESYKKVMTGDFVISVSRRIEDKLANTARWHIIKNRYGIDGITFPSKVDASIGKIEIFAPTTEKGVSATKEMKQGEKLKVRKAAQIYNQMNEEKLQGFEEGK